jgi:hypothetical protein
MIVTLLALSISNVDLSTDLPATLSMAGVAMLLEMEKSRWAYGAPCGGSCDASSINGLDRWVIENDSSRARFASDLGLNAMALLPLLNSIDDPGDTMIGYEALAATMLTTQILKIGFRRARPLAYNSAFQLEDREAADAQLSFPSGHSSMSFASATAFAVPWLRHHDGATAFAGVAASYALATAIASLRVAGGKHFVTDVLAGAVLGVAVGLAVTFAHRQDMDVR